MKNKEELDTSSLHSGMVVKNYEEMCRLLHQDVTNGNSKKSQLEQWRRYFDWENDGYKFIILTVYEEPIAGMLPDSVIYAKFMQLALMEAFDNINGGTYHFFATRLMERVGIRELSEILAGFFSIAARLRLRGRLCQPGCLQDYWKSKKPHLAKMPTT